MSVSISNLSTQEYKFNDCSTNAERDFDIISNSLINENIYIPFPEEEKRIFDKGWNEKNNLITKEEAREHIENNGNIGLSLGKWFNGNTYVAFDVEKEGVLPEDLKAIVDNHAVETHYSLHDGLNRIVKIDNKDTYNLIDSLPTEYDNLDKDDETDLEILTAGSCVIPPSVVSHTHCSSEKPCNGKGVGDYQLLSTNTEAPTLSRSTVERVADILGVDIEQNQEPDYTNQEVKNVPSPTPNFNIQKEFKNNVPSVEHTFYDRLQYMKFGNWKGQELFIKLWNGNFEDINGSQKQGRGELKLANYFGFFFGNNENMVRLLMDMAPFETHYEKYESHRKTLLEYATSVDWCYCEEVNLETKLTVAIDIWTNDSISQKELTKSSGISERHIRRVTDILEKENYIEKEYRNNERIYKNKAITLGLLTRLDNIAKRGQNKEDK